jgi:protein subunit release factor B
MIRVPDTLELDDSAVNAFCPRSGPGGQNVNKVAIAVGLHVDIPKSSLPPM